MLNPHTRTPNSIKNSQYVCHLSCVAPVLPSIAVAQHSVITL